MTGQPSLGSAECPVSPYYQQLAAAIRPGNSLLAWVRYWKTADAQQYNAGPHGQRIAQARLLDTLDQVAPPVSALPPVDFAAADASVRATVAAAKLQASQNALAEDLRVEAFLQSLGSNAP